MTATHRLPDVQLYMIATIEGLLSAEAKLQAVAEGVRGGVQAVQLRMKTGSLRERQILLRELRERIGPACLLIVNDDLDAAFDAGGQALADGVHLGRDDAAKLSTRPAQDPERLSDGLTIARARLGPELCLGTSTREPWEIERALEAGADHVGFGAMSPSRTKANTQPASAEELVAVTREFAPFPIFPIGGLDATRLSELAALGVRRAAVGSAILAAEDPAAAAAACRAALAQT